MTSNIESLKSLSLTELKNYAKAIKTKIKIIKNQSNINENTQLELDDFIKELNLVEEVMADKEIEETKQQMIKNSVVQTLKNIKPR